MRGISPLGVKRVKFAPLDGKNTPLDCITEPLLECFSLDFLWKNSLKRIMLLTVFNVGGGGLKHRLGKLINKIKRASAGFMPWGRGAFAEDVNFVVQIH